MSRYKTRLIYGWGINDVDHVVRINEELLKINGKRKQKQIWVCPYYDDWKKLIERCFDPKLHQKRPTYKDCTICEGWKYLSNFIKWVDSQPNKDWQNCALDKDLLVYGNKHYGPDTCSYISRKLNTFILDQPRGSCMVGVTYKPNISKEKPYQSRCNNPFTGKCDYLGMFPTELEAHLVWKTKKHEHACKLAECETDSMVRKALVERYKSLINITKQ